MPCNIGYKTVSRVRVPTRQPKELRERTEAPKVDADLLEKIGVDDPDFLKWLLEYDFTSVMREALQRALRTVGETYGVSFAVAPGGLSFEGRARYVNSSEKEKAEKIIRAVSDRWQIEALGIVAELLNYQTRIVVRGSDVILEGEKLEQGETISRYMRVTKSGQDATVVFEHFASSKLLAAEQAKFLGLAQRLGVKVVILDAEESGSPIPQTMTVEEFHRLHGHEHGGR